MPGFPPAGPSPEPAPAAGIGRIPVLDVGPVVEGGRWPTKAVVGEVVPVRATVFRDGHEYVSATAVLIDPEGRDHSALTMRPGTPGLDDWHAEFVPDRVGRWYFRVEGWSDPLATWAHDAVIKVDADVDTELMLTEGALLLEAAAARPGLPAGVVAVLMDAVAGLRDSARPAAARLAAGTDARVRSALAAHPVRRFVTASATYPLQVHRREALFSSWYEFFPRSEGATFDEASGTWTSGTLRTAAERLPGIAAMGFDVVYLTPIHPIGSTNRKGRNNTLTCEPGDPGSPYGIGAADGGHDAVHADLGTFDDFDDFVARARGLGMEVALDLALQASPDHPWAIDHPDWFTVRADGTIAYAENPPKKYQDIYPLNFDRDPEGIYEAVRDVVYTWIDHGVTAFRVDNPHTKPLTFWERLLAEVASTHPHVIFLSEAFTKPAMMRALALIGFHQSYTYFTWRNTKEELSEYLAEVAGDSGAVLRPSFWPTTHDILTPYMQQGGQAAFAIRAVLAATGSPTWGIYSGYEFAESVARPGAEEQIDNEKYEFKPRDWTRAEHIGLATLLTRLNQLRAAHPALQQLRNLTVHGTTDDAIVCFSKRIAAEHSPTGTDDVIIVAVTTDPFATREGRLFLDMHALGLHHEATFVAEDLLSGDQYLWDRTPFVRLDPHGNCAHIISVRSSGGRV
nr:MULTISPECIES: alpha-1,4-glucan--maltose-1-phosphate maltosyltransferase [unclassified Pseudactinotalea]